MAKETEKRKADHIRICLEDEVEFRKSSGFERVELEHRSLPETSMDEIGLSTSFLGKPFKAPIFIEAMTGGSGEGGKINRNLAAAAEELGLGMGVGSQRAALENKELAGTFQVRDVAPSIFLLGNMGAAQLLNYDFSRFQEAVDMIGADGLAIHLNAAQELVQPEGDREWKGVMEKLGQLCTVLKKPVVAKETGCGISGIMARKLQEAGVSAIDVAGAGGTSWPKVEAYRSGGSEEFSEWGIQTAFCLKDCRESVKLPIIASGGIRTGLDVAKAIAMGADLAGMALPLLRPATESKEAVKSALERVIEELKKAMMLVGARNLEELRKTNYRLL